MCFDTVIIGAGPAGSTAALYLARAGMNIALFENTATGGQILSTAEIENYPGFPNGIKGWELADSLDAHLAHYPISRFHKSILSVESAPLSRYILHCEDFDAETKSIVICSGASHSKLGVQGEEDFSGKGVSYCAVCDGNFYAGRDIAVVGGGNSALEEALYLSRIVNKIYLIHRRDTFRAAKIYQEKIAQANNIEILTNCVINQIQGNTSGVTHIETLHKISGEKRQIPVEGVFIYVGMKPSNQFLPKEIALDQQGFVITDAEMASSLPGIFAAGDIRSKHCRQVATAVGDGAAAASAVLSYLEHLNA